MRKRRLSRTFCYCKKRATFPSGPKHEYNSESEAKQEGLTMSWGVSLPSSRSHTGRSSQIPQMCHSLLSPQKPPDDLEKQRHVNNIACVKHQRWYHRRRQTPQMKGEIASALIRLRRLNCTSAVRRQIRRGCLCSFSPEPGRIDW